MWPGFPMGITNEPQNDPMWPQHDLKDSKLVDLDQNSFKVVIWSENYEFDTVLSIWPFYDLKWPYFTINDLYMIKCIKFDQILVLSVILPADDEFTMHFSNCIFAWPLNDLQRRWLTFILFNTSIWRKLWFQGYFHVLRTNLQTVGW